METYYIADMHLGHKNILAYDNRPFKVIEEHDCAIINNWNNRVKEEDDVYILGDISWYNPDKTYDIIKSLNGNKHLVIGNHDYELLKNDKIKSLFVEIDDYIELNNDSSGIILCHYPICMFKNNYYGWIHLYGHVHNGFEYNMIERMKYELIELYDKQYNMYNVGCMMPYMNYTPRTLKEIIKNNKGGSYYE